MKYALDNRATFYSPAAPGVGSFGGINEGGMEEAFSRAAKRRILKGRELVEAQARTSQAEAVLTVRADSKTLTVAESWQVVTRDGKRWNIGAIVPLPDTRPRWLEFTLTSNTNQAE